MTTPRTEPPGPKRIGGGGGESKGVRGGGCSGCVGRGVAMGCVCVCVRGWG